VSTMSGGAHGVDIPDAGQRAQVPRNDGRRWPAPLPPNAGSWSLRNPPRVGRGVSTLRAVVTPLQPIDKGQVAEFWSRFLEAGMIDSSPSVPDTVEPFGDSAELADKLIELVIHGSKQATAGALVDFDLEGVRPPQPRLADPECRARGGMAPRRLRPAQRLTGFDRRGSLGGRRSVWGC
jgi:hypothetical protein